MGNRGACAKGRPVSLLSSCCAEVSRSREKHANGSIAASTRDCAELRTSSRAAAVKLLGSAFGKISLSSPSPTLHPPPLLDAPPMNRRTQPLSHTPPRFDHGMRKVGQMILVQLRSLVSALSARGEMGRRTRRRTKGNFFSPAMEATTRGRSFATFLPWAVILAPTVRVRSRAAMRKLRKRFACLACESRCVSSCVAKRGERRERDERGLEASSRLARAFVARRRGRGGSSPIVESSEEVVSLGRALALAHVPRKFTSSVTSAICRISHGSLPTSSNAPIILVACSLKKASASCSGSGSSNSARSTVRVWEESVSRADSEAVSCGSIDV